jgi:hypothetical protein
MGVILEIIRVTWVNREPLLVSTVPPPIIISIAGSNVTVAVNSFHPFPKLLSELRLLTWEYIWPEARLIEAGSWRGWT